MKAVNDYIVVQKLKVEPKKVAGLIMTEDVDEDNRYIKATVISTGNLVEAIKDKDVVYYDNTLDTEFSIKINCTRLFARVMWY
tara:strand:+ start:90 stop:338 length:249 start_codon:yes stop_codon:yes gene_type:complete